MSDNKTSMRSLASSGHKTLMMILLFLFGLVVFGLGAFWTASHNIPLMTQRTDEAFRVFGTIAAVTGEVFVIVCYLFLFVTAGLQRTTILIAKVLMWLVLIFNSMVRYAQLGAGDPRVDQVINIYGTYIAPFPVFLLSFFGIIAIIETSADVRARNAEHDTKVKEQERKTLMRRWTDKRTEELMEHMPEVDKWLEASAILSVVAQAKDAFRAMTGRDATDAEIEQALALVQRRGVDFTPIDIKQTNAKRTPESGPDSGASSFADKIAEAIAATVGKGNGANHPNS